MKKLSPYLFALLMAIGLGPSTEKHPAGNPLRLISCSLKPLPASARHHLNGAPHIRIRESTSLNWSGYAAVAGSLASPAVGAVTAVSGSWTVPAVTGSGTRYSSVWVGIDGYADGTVEQLGTEQDVVSVRRGHIRVTSQRYYTWFEMYPAGGYEVGGFPTNPGDKFGAGVAYAGGDTFTLAITNFTQNVYYIVPPPYNTTSGAQLSSAEWIAEAPSSFSGVLPLADFGTVTFTACSADINGTTGPISDFTYDPLTMETSTGTKKAVPSALSPDGSSFSVTWYHY